MRLFLDGICSLFRGGIKKLLWRLTQSSLGCRIPFLPPCSEEDGGSVVLYPFVAG